MTMTTKIDNPQEDDVCTTCQKTYGWHVENRPRHAFNPGGSVPVSATFGRRRADGTNEPSRGRHGDAEGAGAAVLGPYPFDPVLRQALVDKGVITGDDLREAERKIADMSTIIFGQVSADGK
jgi:hypothetical protein